MDKNIKLVAMTIVGAEAVLLCFQGVQTHRELEHFHNTNYSVVISCVYKNWFLLAGEVFICVCWWISYWCTARLHVHKVCTWVQIIFSPTMSNEIKNLIKLPCVQRSGLTVATCQYNNNLAHMPYMLKYI